MQENIYTNTVDASPIYSDIVFNLCKMIEHLAEHTIEEGFTKSIVDSRDREKEFKRSQAYQDYYEDEIEEIAIENVKKRHGKI